jgi:hypothetical protein
MTRTNPETTDLPAGAAMPARALPAFTAPFPYPISIRSNGEAC